MPGGASDKTLGEIRDAIDRMCAVQAASLLAQKRLPSEVVRILETVVRDNPVCSSVDFDKAVRNRVVRSGSSVAANAGRPGIVSHEESY